MEDDSHHAFYLNDAKIPIQIRLKKLADLKPHEETVQSDLETIVANMRQETVLRHPIIADISTGIVLDGTHRLAALRVLGCEYVPAALIDYQSPLIGISRWFRIIAGEKLTSFIKKTKSFNPVQADPSELDKSLIERSSFATLSDGHHGFLFRSQFLDSLYATRQAFKIEQIARSNALSISYRDSAQIEVSEIGRFVMAGIRVSKSEVINVTRKDQLFPPKTTRHLIPSRPLVTRTPLEWLRGKDHREAEALFQRELQKKKVKRLPEGSWVGSRRYQEEVFIFE